MLRFAFQRVAIGGSAFAAVNFVYLDSGKETSLWQKFTGMFSKDPNDMRWRMEAFVKRLQTDIVDALEKVEGPQGKKFIRDSWQRPDNGGQGLSCVLQGGKVFEKAGVNVSVINGNFPEAMMQQMRARKKTDLGEGPFRMFAAGVSMVLHPNNPNAPTVHLNYRYFELRDANDKKVTSWFGGGSDLTPAYLFEEDARDFHRVIKEACDKTDIRYYPKFKKWCDEYFSNSHRGETRGIGGIFFDDLDDRDPEQLFQFVQDCGNAFLKQYIPIIEKRKDMEFTSEMKRWQQLRRGRYVEFNLIHDRGTKFGLATPSARIESILMSLPLTARWEYMHEPAKGSPEDELVKVLKSPREWI